MTTTVPVAHTPDDVRAALQSPRRAGRTVGFVPTMGALHEGHLSLVETAKASDSFVVVSIFVNPLQFGPAEDLHAYPRDLQADLDLLVPLDVDLVFHPNPGDFTPADRMTTVSVVGLTQQLEGASRPGHFDGVTTIVAKLLNVVEPDHVYFGEKDFQQQAVIRRMIADLDMRAEVVTCPVVRDADGLALSSRNRFLSHAERQDALAISWSLRMIADVWEGNIDSGRSALMAMLNNAPGIRLDYVEIIDPRTLQPLEGVHDGDCQAVVAAYVGSTRLIDTMQFAGPSISWGA